jgi:hypothetical protein
LPLQSVQNSSFNAALRNCAQQSSDDFAIAKRMSLRKISAALAARGYVTAGGKAYVATAVQAMPGYANSLLACVILGRQESRGRALETLRRSGRPLPSPRKSDDVGVSVSLGFSHPVEGECNKIISEGLIVSQFSQTSAFACVVGVVIGGHGERSRWRLPGFARQPSQRPRVPKPKSDEARLPALTLTAEK